jgi:hypothetical protein
MEVEVHEPGLFFPMAPEAAELLAAAILNGAVNQRSRSGR